jgi:tetratricopeptide (TPR) repeat protein
MDRANRYFAAGQYDAAEIEYLNVLALDRGNAEAIGRLGVIYFDQGRMGKALPFLLAGRRMEPENLEVRLEFGLYLLAFAKFQEAKDEANFILDHAPSNSDAPLLLAEASVRPKEIEEARKRLMALPAPVPDGAPVLVALGTLDFRQRRFPEAEALFKRALAADPKSSAAYTALGALYWASNDAADAGQAFAKAVDLSNARSTKRLQYAQFKIQTGDREGGRKILEDMIQKAPDFLPASLQLAEIDEQDKLYDASAAAVATVLARDPTYPDAMLLSGRLWLERGKPDKAVDVLEYAKGVFPTYSQIDYELARAYLAEGATDKAATNLALAVGQDPDFVEAVIALVNIDTNKGDWASVINLLPPLIEKHPELLQARYLLANAYIQNNQPAAAIGTFRQISAAKPNDPQPILLTGMVLLRQNDLIDARTEFETALKMAPDFTPALEQLINLDIGDRQLAAAKQRIEGKLAKESGSARLHVLLARVYLAQKEFGAAEGELKRAIELKEDSPTPYFLLGEIYYSNKEDGKALTDLKQVVAKNPKAVEALMLMATIEERKKDYPAARDTYEKVLAEDPNFAPALNNLAYLYAEKLENLDKAFDLAQQARKVLPNEPNVADTLGWVLFKRHQYTWGLGLLAESGAALPMEPATQYHLGMLQYMLDDEAAAKASFERALKAGRDFDGIDQMKDRLALLAIDSRTAGAGERSTLEKAAAERPDDPVVLSRLVALYERDHDLDKAIAACETAINANPKDVSVMRLLAGLYTSKGQASKGFELAKAAHNLAPSDPEVAEILGRLAFAMHDYHWSLSLLSDSTAKLPNDPDAQFDLARALYSVGNVADSESAVRHALDLSARFGRANEARAFLDLVSLGDDPKRAASESERVDALVKAEPDNGPALVAQGEADEEKGDAAAAIQAYESALSRFPDFTPAERRLIILYSKNPTIGIKRGELATKAREAYPKDPEVAKACGIVDYLNGDYRRAEELLEDGAGRLSGDAELVYYLGMAQYRLKEKSSRSTLERALSMDLRNDLATEVRHILSELR